VKSTNEKTLLTFFQSYDETSVLESSLQSLDVACIAMQLLLDVWNTSDKG